MEIRNLDEILDEIDDFGRTKNAILDNVFLGCLSIGDTAVVYVSVIVYLVFSWKYHGKDWSREKHRGSSVGQLLWGLVSFIFPFINIPVSVTCSVLDLYTCGYHAVLAYFKFELELSHGSICISDWYLWISMAVLAMFLF